MSAQRLKVTLSLFILGICLSSCSIQNGYSKRTIPTLTPTSDYSEVSSISKWTTIPENNLSRETVTPVYELELDKIQITPTVTLPTIQSSTPTNKILAWVDPIYGYFEPNQFNWFITPIKAADPKQITPYDAFAFAFSRYSQQIAYLTRDSQIRLWISDLYLSGIQEIADIHGTLALDQFPDTFDSSIIWGPADRYLMIKGKIPVVYSLQSNTFHPLGEECQWVGISPKSYELSLWCPLLDGEYLVLEQNQKEWITIIPPDTKTQEIIDFAFSPEGDQVLIATPDHEILRMDVDGEISTIPSTYMPPPPFITAKTMQWSKNGKFILIFGNHNESVCSDDVGTTINCWALRDSSTGELIWHSPIQINEPWDATLSRDGVQIALFFRIERGAFIDVGSIFFVTSDEEIAICDCNITTIFWDD
jgi:hypothetical protein